VLFAAPQLQQIVADRWPQDAKTIISQSSLAARS